MSNFTCPNPTDFPLFSNSFCVSRELYTTLLLISITVSGFTFIVFVILLICIIHRRLSRPKPKYDTSSIHDLKANHLGARATPAKPKKEISSVLKKIVRTTTNDNPSQKHLHYNIPMPNFQESFISSTTSYGELYSVPNHSRRKLFRSMQIDETLTESFELPNRQSTHHSNTTMNDADSTLDDSCPRKYSTKF